ncbi:predicted protein [Naegleria gruberi]|uniref:Predicted protein n=1 Tax=Naegleria gruberi TaxID=5762 RepID=D2VEN3_NAEGR|nr:uncharacterized protein NAEGRDRAFT_67336 [Naegleria gruberi]EFC44532.1 predicted protein [Naegleria gruberi]|eukprot:XP_002677276.1 predicted protein [Naegleria gruberi strain NEG-M]
MAPQPHNPFGHVQQKLNFNPKNVTANFTLDYDSVDGKEPSNLDESWAKDSELDPREIYMNHCSKIGIDPTFEFIFALNDKNIKSCILSNRKKMLTDKDVICIATALTTNKHILELDLSDNNLTEEISSYLGDMLKRNTVLQKFTCGNNKLGDQGISYIYQCIGSNPFSLVNYIDLRGNRISSAAAYLSSVFASNRIQILNLQNNLIDEEGAKVIAFELMNNTSLKVLNLQHNKIGDKGASHIAKMLASNITLQELDLGSNRISVEGASSLVTGLKSNKSLLKLNLRSNIMGDPGAYMFSKCLTQNSNFLEELYLGFNGFTIDGAVALSNMLKTNNRLKKFDIQGIMLDLTSMKIISDSLKENHSLLKLYLDIDSDSTKLAPQVAKTISEALQSNNTLQDLIIGGDMDFEESINPRNSMSSMPSSVQSTPRQHFSKDMGKKQFALEESPRIHFGHPVNHSQHSALSHPSMKPIDTSYKGLFDDVLGEDEISDVDSEPESVNIPVQETKLHKQPSTPSNENCTISHKQFKLIEDRFEKLEQLVFTIQKETKESINHLFVQVREDVDSVKNYSTRLIDTSLKNYHSNFEHILQQYNVNSTPLKGSLSMSPTKSINNSLGALRESSAYLEQLKAELEMKVASSVREVEERIQGRITDVDYRFNQSIATLHKCVDEKLERQQKVIGRMTEEQRWIEEEGIKLRVQHEAKVENMIKTIKTDLEQMISESKQSVTDTKSTLSLKYNTIEKRVEDLQKRFHFEEENRQLLNTLTRTTQHLPDDASYAPPVVNTNNEGNKRGSSLSMRSSPSSTNKGSTNPINHHRSPNSHQQDNVDPTHYNMIQALLSKSKEVLERNQGATSPTSTTSSQRSRTGSTAYRPSTPAEREY